MMEGLAARAIPTVLINGRMSPKSFRRWRLFRPMARRLLAPFALCLAQTKEDAARFSALGAVDARAVGNIKYAALPLASDKTELARLRAQAGGRALWVMASTHPGEEEIALAAHRFLKAEGIDALTIIAPRHPARAEAIAAMLTARGAKIARRSKGEPLLPETEIYLADSLGEMGLFYRLAPVTGMGGSFVWGGHNPIEPAQLSSAVIAGPRMSNFEAMAEEMRQAGALMQVPTPEAFYQALASMLKDPTARARQIAAALHFAEQKRNVLPEILSLLAPLLARLKRG
jgi:3-deoxy-D-manno-octulosonic-acid transferase